MRFLAMTTGRSGLRHRRPRRGAAIVYTVVVLTALCAICSLAADLARVQMIKGELRAAADAAARAGAAGLPSITAAQDQAVAAAGQNRADGSAVSVDAADVELGTWDAEKRTFTPLTGAARAGADAVRVTAGRTAAR